VFAVTLRNRRSWNNSPVQSRPGIRDSQMPATARVAAPVERAERHRHELAGGGEQDRAVQWLG
jgi:hypothetical protein